MMLPDEAPPIELICPYCKVGFDRWTALHSHVRDDCPDLSPGPEPVEVLKEEKEVDRDSQRA